MQWNEELLLLNLHLQCCTLERSICLFCCRCIPFRVNNSDPEDVEVLMVSRRFKDSLVFPKVRE